jgi:hypothetical protein
MPSGFSDTFCSTKYILCFFHYCRTVHFRTLWSCFFLWFCNCLFFDSFSFHRVSFFPQIWKDFPRLLWQQSDQIRRIFARRVIVYYGLFLKKFRCSANFRPKGDCLLWVVFWIFRCTPHFWATFSKVKVMHCIRLLNTILGF